MSTVIELPPPQALLAAGDYIRLRRKSAGLSIRDVALMLISAGQSPASVIAHVTDIERGAILPTSFMVDALRSAFAFDPYIFQQLASGLPAPTICRSCACSWADACDDEEDGPCAWSDADPTLCTRCERSAAA